MQAVQQQRQRVLLGGVRLVRQWRRCLVATPAPSTLQATSGRKCSASFSSGARCVSRLPTSGVALRCSPSAFHGHCRLLSQAPDSGAHGKVNHEGHAHASHRGPHVVTLNGMKHLVEAGGAVIIDVREPHEFESGHIPSAVNVPLNTLLAAEDLDARADDSEDATVGDYQLPSADEKVVVYCRAGVRSRLAQVFLQGKGWHNCSNFVGSWLQWDDDPDVPKVVHGIMQAGSAQRPESRRHIHNSPPVNGNDTAGHSAATAEHDDEEHEIQERARFLFDDFMCRKPQKWGEVSVVGHFSDSQWELLHVLPMLIVSPEMLPTDKLDGPATVFLLLRQFDKTTMPLGNKGVERNGYELYLVSTEGYKYARYATRISSEAAAHLLAERGDDDVQ